MTQSHAVVLDKHKEEQARQMSEFQIAMEDKIITAEERKFLVLQAKTLGLDQERIDHLEGWYDDQLSEEEE